MVAGRTLLTMKAATMGTTTWIVETIGVTPMMATIMRATMTMTMGDQYLEDSSLLG
jgi:hypothetical protein